MSEDRLTALESKVAFLEDTINTLNEELTEQGRQLESVRTDCRQIAEQQKNLATEYAERGGADELPPHY